jgi:hypothetical protein
VISWFLSLRFKFNLYRYSSGLRMDDIMGLDLEDAELQLPAEERGYSGSNAARLTWPYA